MIEGTSETLEPTGDYKGAIDFTNSTFGLNIGLETEISGYMITDPNGFEGMITHRNEDNGATTNVIEITKSSFRNSLATFSSALSHEYQHILTFDNPVLSSMSRNVREVISYHKQIFNSKLPKAPYSEMEGYYNSAKGYLNKLTPMEIKFLQPMYDNFINANFFNFSQ